MTLAAWVLAEILALGTPEVGPATERYSLSDFCASIEHDSFRYRLADFSSWVERDSYRYHLAEFTDAVERDAERCICMTTRMSPATLKAEVLLVTDCECGK